MSSDVVPLVIPDRREQVVADLNTYAVNLRGLGKYATAIVALQRAIAIDPKHPQLWSNLGNILWNMGRFEDALEPMRRAAAMDPTSAAYHGNLGLLYASLRMFDEAETEFASAIDVATTDQDRMGAIWDRGLMRLEQGDWARGLVDYDIRIPLRGAPLYLGFPCPTWNGEDLAGKSLYVAPEQGLGDRILLSRYFAVIKARWPTCRIVTCVNDTMVNLLWEFRDQVEFVFEGCPWQDFDYAIHQASLIRVLSPDPVLVPADPGLIKARVEQERALGKFECPQPHLGGLKIGIAWTGNPEMLRNAERSIPLDLLLTLAEDPDITLFGFQVGEGSEQIAEHCADDLVFNFGPELGRLGLVAAGVAMSEMDVIITACTSTAHLAGALGLNVWTLLCFDPYWVWLQDGAKRETTVWYPSMRLYRQPRPGDWATVIAQVRDELTKLHGRCEAPGPLREIA